MRALTVSLVVFLSACTFGVPMGERQVSTGKTPEKSKYGNPESYVVMGQRYFVMDSADGYKQRGKASWYGPDFHGKRTSSGETYNMHAMTAAHKTLPIPVYVRVRNLENGKTAVVKVNDRGPFAHNRIIDLSYAAAKKLGVVGPGTADVEVIALNSPDDKTHPTVRAIPLSSSNAEEGEVFVQLGSFGSEVNAQNLLSQLKQHDENPIMISRIDTGDGVFYRVRLGPLLDISEADSVQKRLQRKGYEDTRIVIGDE